MPSKERRHKGDLNAVCDRQQARADQLLIRKRLATLTCPGIALLVHGTTTLHIIEHCYEYLPEECNLLEVASRLILKTQSCMELRSIGNGKCTVAHSNKVLYVAVNTYF